MQIGKKTLLILIMLVELNSSCSARIPARTMPSFTSSPSSASQLGIPPPTIINSPISRTNFSCWLIKPLEEGNDIKGSFFYFHEPVPQNSGDNNYFVWDISSFHGKEHVLNKRIWHSMISFNGNTVNVLGDDLFFISKDDIQSYLLPDEPLVKKNLYIKYEYPRIDGRILMSEYREIDNYKEGVGFTDTFYVFDPESRKITVHQLFLPNLHKMVNRNPFAQYSSSMKYALYEASPDNNNHRQYTFYDIENEKIVMVIPPQDSNLVVVDDNPQWLPNTDIVTAEFYDRITKKYSQYLVSLDGTISLITNLPDDVGVSNRYFSDSHYWSPNNYYFALLDSNLFLYLWDNQTETLYKPCLPNENNIISAPQLTWSFDGNYVVVTLVSPSLATPIVDPSGQIIEQRIVRKYILDFSNKIVYSLPNDVNERESPQNFTDGSYQYIGWVNWEIP